MKPSVLWLCRAVPFPTSTGDRAYSAGLLKGLSRYADVTFVGLGDVQALQIASRSLPDVRWLPVDAPLRSAPLAILSQRPLAAARLATPAMIRAARDALQSQPFDCVVLDLYALGWALDELGDLLARKKPLVVYISHNLEAELAADMARGERSNPLKRVALDWNARKVARMERALLARADIVTAICDDDARGIVGLQPGTAPLVLHPGAELGETGKASVTTDTPRHLVMVGTFHWLPKQMNLFNFLEQADGVAKATGARLDIIGDTPDGLRDELATRYDWIRFLGFVDDLDGLASTYRMALNIEQIGGGFKLKNLTYVTAGLPIAALTASLTGLPHELKDLMIVREEPAALLSAAVSAMDDVDDLQRRAAAATAIARRLYDWDRSGQTLAGAIRAAIDRSVPHRIAS